MPFYAQVACSNGHGYETEVIAAEDTPDGDLLGSLGSEADFCPVCEREGITDSKTTVELVIQHYPAARLLNSVMINGSEFLLKGD